MKPLKIGSVKIKNRLFLAPMVDISDLPYRLICRKAGAGMAYIEMLYIDAITHENFRTMQLMKTSKEDKPSGIQITGNNPEEIEKAIKMKVFDGYDIVDINCGCPSSRITGNEAGSFLLKNPEKIVKMIKLLKKAKYTVTAKIRLGFENNNVVEIAKMIEKAGADAITIHARLAVHSNKIPADWSWIKKVKENVKIPVIGNGDITTGKQAEEMLKIADGAMIARGAIGDPFIFERILEYLETGKEPEFDAKKNIVAFKDYIKLCQKYGYTDLHRIKYIGTNFLRKFDGAAKLRGDFMKLKSLDEINKFVKGL